MIKSMKKVLFQKGIALIYIIAAVLTSIILLLAFVLKFMPEVLFNKTKSPQSTASSIDKTDPKWLEKYCIEKVDKFPEAPFKYENKNPPSVNMPSAYISEKIPKGKKQSTCQVSFHFDTEKAYSSLGVKWGADIRLNRAFEEKVDNLITPKMAGWEKISPLISDKEAGRPGYAYQGFPMIFKQDSPISNTTDYVDFIFGGNQLYVELTTHEK